MVFKAGSLSESIDEGVINLLMFKAGSLNESINESIVNLLVFKAGSPEILILSDIYIWSVTRMRKLAVFIAIVMVDCCYI